jgi:hypothetical protein
MKTLFIIACLLPFAFVSCCSEKKAIQYILSSPNAEYVLQHDTIVRAAAKIDTFVVVSKSMPDTIVKYTDRAVIRILQKNDTIQVSAECKTDTLILPKQVIVYKNTTSKNDTKWWGFGLFGLIFACFMGYLILKKI